MDLRRVHTVSGATLALFIAVHLINHLTIFFGAEVYLEVMDALRAVYRNVIIESLLLVAVLLQVCTGLKLYFKIRKRPKLKFKKIQVYTGLYLSFFLIAHVSAVLFGRSMLGLDTNLYFGATVVNTFPYFFFFIPYYYLAVTCTFLHINCAFNKIGNQKSLIISGLLGSLVAILIIFGMWPVEIPEAYQSLYQF